MTTPQGQDRLQQRRCQLLDAAVKVIGRDGFEKARMSDIAEEAGVAKGTLYNYFESKEHLFTAILTECALAPQLEILSSDGMSPGEELAALAHDYFTGVVDKRPEIVRLVILDVPHFPDEALLVYEKLVIGFDKAVGKYLDEQAAQGKLRPRKDFRLTARAFFGMMLVHAFAQELLGGKRTNPIDRQEWIEEIVDIFLHGVAQED